MHFLRALLTPAEIVVLALALIVAFTVAYSYAQTPTTLTLVKVVVNDNGGNPATSNPTQWNLFAVGDTVDEFAGPGGVSGEVAPGTYFIGEDGGPPDGYAPSPWVCSGFTTNGGSLTPPDVLVIKEGENVTCTITNDDIAPTLKLIKVVSGGVAVPGDFTLSASATTSPASDFNFSDNGDPEVATTTHTIRANTFYIISESGPSDYRQTGLACDVGNVVGSSTVNLDAGINATCTVTNTYTPGGGPTTGTLTLQKTVVNDEGGTASADEFQAMIDGSAVAWDTPATLSPGSYTASETTLAGYIAGSWGGDCAADGTVVLAAGENKTCTILNDDEPPPPPPAPTSCTDPLPPNWTLVQGTRGRDKVILGPNTKFEGLGGNDLVVAPTGDQIICLGNGNDHIIGGSGTKVVEAGKGNNLIVLGDGDNKVIARGGNDIIAIGNGANVVEAGGGNNQIALGNGGNAIVAGNGNDHITTGGGNDTIDAGNGNNKIYAGDGDDTITAGSGNDHIDGGSGIDSCFADGGHNTLKNCE